MNRIYTLKARIVAMQEELKVLEVAKFKMPVRCTLATVNAALEAGGSCQVARTASTKTTVAFTRILEVARTSLASRQRKTLSRMSQGLLCRSTRLAAELTPKHVAKATCYRLGMTAITSMMLLTDWLPADGDSWLGYFIIRDTALLCRGWLLVA